MEQMNQKKVLKEIGSQELAVDLLISHTSATLTIMHDLGLSTPAAMDCLLEASAFHMASGMFALVKTNDVGTEAINEFFTKLGEQFGASIKQHFDEIWKNAGGDIRDEDDDALDSEEGMKREDEEDEGELQEEGEDE